MVASQARASQSGATLVEFAIILPLLLLLLFGIIEFARVVTEFTTVRTAAREGARYATTVGTPDAPHYTDCQGIIDAAQAQAVVGDVTDVSVKWSGPDGYSFANCAHDSINDPDPEDILSGTEITVVVTSNFDSVLPIFEVFLDDLELTSEQTRQVFKGLIEHEE